MSLKKTPGSLLLFIIATLLAWSPLAAQADEGYWFQPSTEASARCGDFTPTDVQLKQRTRGDRYQVHLSFEITQAQLLAEKCAGSHFDLKIVFSGFDPWDDWNSCKVKYSHPYTFGWDIASDGEGAATVTVSGAKMAENRLSAGDEFWVTVDCHDLWGGYDVQRVSVEYVGTWYSVSTQEPGCEATRFETTGTDGRQSGLPVCAFQGPSATLVNWYGDTQFPFDD